MLSRNSIIFASCSAVARSRFCSSSMFRMTLVDSIANSYGRFCFNSICPTYFEVRSNSLFASEIFYSYMQILQTQP